MLRWAMRVAIAGSGHQAIDPIAHGDEFEAGGVTALSNIAATGTKLTDHFEVSMRLTLTPRHPGGWRHKHR